MGSADNFVRFPENVLPPKQQEVFGDVYTVYGFHFRGLHDFYDFGSFIAQPRWFDITPQYCEESRKLGIRSNVYYANLAEDAQRFVDCGIDGILTDYPENIFPVVNKIG